MNLTLPTVNTPLSLFIFILVCLLGGIWFLSQMRRNDMETLRATNKDQGDRISLLEKAVTRLQEEVDFLQKRNKTLEDLVVTSLKQYFFENPKVASTLKDIVAPS